MPKSPAPFAPQTTHWLLTQLPGMSEADAIAYQQLGITTTAQLLQAGATPAHQQELANRLKCPIQQVRKWVAIAQALTCQFAHLSQLPAIGCTHCGLLLHSGIASIPQLAQTPVQRLYANLLRFHVAQLQRRDLCPTIEEVKQWVQEARVWLRSH